MAAGFEDGWAIVNSGITRRINILEGKDRSSFTPAQYMVLYSTIYNMCMLDPAPYHRQQLYDRFREVTVRYLNESVEPPARGEHDAGFFLGELVPMLTNHKLMLEWLVRLFSYLDRFFVTRRRLVPLGEVALDCFRNSVYEAVKGTARDAMISQIEQEREGNQIDRSVLKNVVRMFVVMDEDSMDCYNNDFEEAMLKATGSYYSRKAMIWSARNSFPEYMIKVKECLNCEKDRVSDYLHHSTEQKLLESVQKQLLAEDIIELLVEKHTGWDNKVDDLSRIYTMFHSVPRGLDAIALFFRRQIVAEGCYLVKLASDSKKSEKKHAVDSYEEVFVRNLIELHERCMNYVLSCFQSNALFQRALDIAFHSFCCKSIDGSSIEELLATFCDNILTKGAGGGGSKKLDVGEIEEMLEKVVRLLVYITDKQVFAKFCREKLAQRLLSNTSKEHEKSFLIKLKEQLGCEFTSKMEGMINDISLASGCRIKCKDYLRNKPKDIPEETERCLAEFKKLYIQSKWSYSLGTSNVMGRRINVTIDTSLVWIMKSHNKVADYQYLVTECVEQLSRTSIKPDLKLINERIEHLMTKGYLKRDKKDPNVFHYLV